MNIAVNIFKEFAFTPGPHQSKAIACLFMHDIMFDNGVVDRWHPEAYPIEWVNKIAPIAARFFELNPGLLTPDYINDICSGEHGEKIDRYGKLPGFEALDNILNDYFHDGMNQTPPVGHPFFNS
jgi:hypothetical protein